MSVPESWQSRAQRDWKGIYRIGTILSRRQSNIDITAEVVQEISNLLSNYYQLSDATEQLRQKYETLLRKQEMDASANQGLRRRLSRRINDEIAMNEVRLENTTTRTRPSTLAIRYQDLETVEWLAAKEELDAIHNCGTKLTTEYLCDVFVEAMRVSKEKMTSFTASFTRLLLEPADETVETDSASEGRAGQASNHSEELPRDLQKKVTDIVKQRSDKCNIDGIVKTVKECMREKERYRDRICAESSSTSKALETYVSECCRLAWQMNVQTPPMTISVKTDIPFDPSCHERHYDCEFSGHNNELIDYYVWPTLFDAENQLPVRQKGRVYTKPMTEIVVPLGCHWV